MKKTVIMIVSALFLCLFVLYMQNRQRSQVMEARVLSEKEAGRLQEERTPFGEEAHPTLLINGVNAAYEREEERYYIPRNMEDESWKGRISASVGGRPVSVAWISDPAFSDMRQAVADGHMFQCMIYDTDRYELVSVLFTGLPVMEIQGDMGVMGSKVAVFDPVKSLLGDYQTEESSAYYNIRGNASKRFEKIGYRLELFYDDGAPGRDVSLLGMRTDNDWHLKAMYSDRSKLRDKLSMELWNQIAAETETKADDGCRMEYLELIVNGVYQGLYGLVEPTDYKSLELDKSRDLIYKAASDERPNEELFEESERLQSFSCAGISIRQSSKTFYKGIWEPFRTFWRNSYGMESEEDMQTLYSCIDRQNFIDYDLYYNVIAGMDNRFKNIIYSTVLHADGSYTIRRIPWDQNYSWGDDFEEGEDKDEKNIRYNPELQTRWLNEEVFRNMQAYDSELAEDMKITWRRWRETFLKEEIWKSRAQELMAYLTDSGAFSRDTRRWPDSENVPDTQEIETFIDVRFPWLDAYLEQKRE